MWVNLSEGGGKGGRQRQKYDCRRQESKLHLLHLLRDWMRKWWCFYCASICGAAVLFGGVLEGGCFRRCVQVPSTSYCQDLPWSAHELGPRWPNNKLACLLGPKKFHPCSAVPASLASWGTSPTPLVPEMGVVASRDEPTPGSQALPSSLCHSLMPPGISAIEALPRTVTCPASDDCGPATPLHLTCCLGYGWPVAVALLLPPQQRWRIGANLYIRFLWGLLVSPCSCLGTPNGWVCSDPVDKKTEFRPREGMMVQRTGVWPFQPKRVSRYEGKTIWLYLEKSLAAENNRKMWEWHIQAI